MSTINFSSLQELVRTVNRNKIKSIETLSSSNHGNRIIDFYHKVSDNHFNSDLDAAKYYFGKDPTYPQYRKLKQKLVKKLIASSFFIDVNSAKFNEHQRAYFSCRKNLMSINILLAQYARGATVYLCKETLKYARKYELSDICYEVCKILRVHYSIHQKKKGQYFKYHNLANYYKKVSDIEESMGQTYELMTLESKSRKNLKKIDVISSEFQKRHHNDILIYTEFRIHFHFHLVMLMRHTLLNETENIISTCDQAIAFLESKGFVSDSFIGIFYYHKLQSLLKTGIKKDMKKFADKCISMYQEGTDRWYRSHQYYVNYCFYNRLYSEITEMVRKVKNSDTFSFQRPKIKEKWYLYDAYLYFLFLSKKIDLPIESTIRKFRLSKFINQIPIISSLKDRNNIPVLIIQILILIKQKKFDQLIDRIEAIEKYTTRYLRKDGNYRSNCFIKMLLQVAKQNYHPIAVQRHTERLYQKLLEVPLSEAKQDVEIEIIPYEHLWEMVMESLVSLKVRK